MRKSQCNLRFANLRFVKTATNISIVNSNFLFSAREYKPDTCAKTRPMAAY